MDVVMEPAAATETTEKDSTGNGGKDGPNSLEVPNANKARLINRLTMQDLKAIQDTLFVSRKNEEETELTLDKDQFCGLLEIVLSKGTKAEYIELFEKVDVNKEGFIDWDKLCSHLLLQYYEKDDRTKSTQVPQWQELKYIPCPHKDVIDRFAAVGNPSKFFVSVSREGTVAFWNLDLKLTRSVHVQTNPEEIKPRDLWVTHFTPMSNIHKLALALTGKEIAIYDLSSKSEFNCQYRIFGLKSTPICLDYWSNPNKSSHSILSIGDTGGNIHAIVFTNAAIALFERPLQPAGSKQETCLSVDINDIMRGSYQHAHYYQHSCHTEWVRKIQFLPTLDCFISCSTTNTNSMALGWMEKGTTEMRTTCFSIFQGLNSFDYNSRANLIATAGINTQVCLWNPYVISKPVGILQGHMQSVIAVTFVQNKSQLISMSKEKVLRIWDTHLQVCLQRLSGIFPKIHDASVALYFDHEKSRLFTSFNNQLTLLCMKAEIKDKIISHENAVTDVIYSKNFNQIVSVCAASVITMWMLDTGQKVKQFANAHGSSEITCLAQDPTGMRLLTGSTDGTIKIWDFNGQCHHILMAGNGNPCEVVQILYLKASIVTVGWDKQISCFPTNQLKTFYVSPVDWRGRIEHQDDILAATFLPPKTLATAGFDGDIVLWNVITESAYRHLDAKKIPATKDRGTDQDGSKSFSPIASGKRRSAKLSSRNSTAHSAHRNPNALDQLGDSSTDVLSSAMTYLLHLTSRASPVTANGPAKLVSCTSAGIVVFWNTFTSQIAGEFVAHDQTSSMTMTTDEKDHFLVTGDADGVCKVWSIQKYCQSHANVSIKVPPRLCTVFTPHSDSINAIKVVYRNGRNLILTASSDYCVSLHSMSGISIGICGQEQHWNIEKPLDSEGEDSSYARADKLECKGEIAAGRFLNGEIDEKPAVVEENADLSSTEATELDNDKVDIQKRVQTWDNTILGKSYQQRGNEKRERKQPYSLPFINVERGQMSISAYQALNCKDLSDVPCLIKPDFVLHPEKYFSGNSDKSKSEEIPYLPPIVDCLQQRHDERSLFPKSLLEEMKLKSTSLAFSSYSRHGKGSNPSIHQPVSNSMSVSSVGRPAKPNMDVRKSLAKGKKSTGWNKKILGKIASAVETNNAGSKVETPIVKK
eukprot:Seg278.9 transcript_id=Seg278.9/GoldUCD/mRNA.D3Y31 product="WD repeat-containing protein 49" protein_id=Seg278.9/GoldUCD/D3Y31